MDHLNRMTVGSNGERRYNGRVLDSGTGLYEYGARYYWPTIGRFVSPDTAQPDPSNVMTLNRYAYVLDNPYKYMDPTGSSAVEVHPSPFSVWAGRAAQYLAGVSVDESRWGITRALATTAGVVLTAFDTKNAGTTEIALSVGAIAMGAAPGKAPASAVTAGDAPGFIVTPEGELIVVPKGATGPTPTRAPGVQYIGGSGGSGLDKRVTGVRIMEGTEKQGPRVVYMNESGQTVNPSTGRTVPKSDPAAHLPLKPSGEQ